MGPRTDNAQGEARQFAQDLARLGPERAAAASNKRLDATLAHAEAGPVALACRRGCSYCCHFRVDVTADEVLLIAEYVESRMPADQRAEILRRLEANVAAIAPLSLAEQLCTNVECAFLRAGECSIYPVRPESCRSFHSTDLANCIKAFEHPTDLSIGNAYLAPRHEAGQAHRAGRTAALRESGHDARAYELQSAACEALTAGRAGKRFKRQKAAFIDARVID